MTLFAPGTRDSSGISSRTRCLNRSFGSASRRSGVVAPVGLPVAIRSARRRPFQSRHPQQVVSARHKATPSLRPLLPPVATASQASHRLDPAEDFLHAFPDPQAGLVARVPGRPCIQAHDVHPVLAGRMRRNLPLPTAAHKVPPVVTFVGAERLGDPPPHGVRRARPSGAGPSRVRIP